MNCFLTILGNVTAGMIILVSVVALLQMWSNHITRKTKQRNKELHAQWKREQEQIEKVKQYVRTRSIPKSTKQSYQKTSSVKANDSDELHGFSTIDIDIEVPSTSPSRHHSPAYESFTSSHHSSYDSGSHSSHGSSYDYSSSSSDSSSSSSGGD